MNEIKIAIAIDDIHPEAGWRILGDESEVYLNALNKEFGAKFTLFVPSNFHGNFPLSLNKKWVEDISSISYFELAAHGHFHACNRKDIGEQEFLELDYDNAVERLKLCLGEWQFVGINPSGFRMPGWGCNQQSATAVSEKFKYIAAHELINYGIKFSSEKVFYGSYGIHQSDDIPISNDNVILFQSHIFGSWNKNTWSQRNFDNIHSILDYLHGMFTIKYVTFNEL